MTSIYTVWKLVLKMIVFLGKQWKFTFTSAFFEIFNSCSFRKCIILVHFLSKQVNIELLFRIKSRMIISDGHALLVIKKIFANIAGILYRLKRILRAFSLYYTWRNDLRLYNSMILAIIIIMFIYSGIVIWDPWILICHSPVSFMPSTSRRVQITLSCGK